MIGIELTIIALAYVAASTFAQRRMIDMKHSYALQDKAKAKSKELQEMMKNKESEAAVAAKQKEVQDVIMETTRSSFKPMLVLVPASLILYYVALPALFPSTAVVTISLLSLTLSYKMFFIAVSFVFGLTLSLTLMARDKAQMKKEQAQLNSQISNN